MKQIQYLFLREISNYFNTAIGYVFAVSSLLFLFLFFFIGVLDIVPPFWEYGIATIRSYMLLLPFIFILLVPAITMRIWAEEKKSGTLELLSTLPFRDIDLVAGKFLAAWAYISGIILASLPLAFCISFLGSLDWGLTLIQYAGSILMAGAYISMGMLISALTSEQVVAFIMTFFASLFMFLSNYYIVTQYADFFSFFSLSYHYNPFSRGLLDFTSTVYYISFVLLMLSINVFILRRAR